MNATVTFLPKASSPSLVAGPSAIISPFLILSPTFTKGFWLMHVFWFDRWNLDKLYISTADWDKSVTSVAFTTILFPSILSTTPFLFATIVTPESNATSDSIPVPTNGDSGLSKGTACLIILEPINALLASSFSKNGIKAAATETNCFGETSI